MYHSSVFFLEWIIRDHNHESQGRLKWIKHERVGYFAISVCEIHTVFKYMIKGLKFTWLIDTVSQLFNFPEFFFDLSNIDHKFENYTFASTENQDPKGHSKRKQIYLHYMPSYFVYIQSYKNKNSPSNNLVKRADWPPLKIFLDPRLLVMSFSLPIYLSRF